MRALFFSALALVIYAIINTVIDQKLRHLSPVVNAAFLYPGIFIVSITIVAFRNQLQLKFTLPENSTQVLILLGCSVLFLIADLSWFEAYHSNGRLEMLSAMFLAFPLFTGLMKGISEGMLPTRSDVLSWAIVAIGLIVSIRQPFK